MRIPDELRKCVVFFGYADTSRKGGIACIGTGFFLEHRGLGYLVTAKHLSHSLGDDPFLIRFNKHDGTSENVHVDGVEWFEHPDPTVDVALRPMFPMIAPGYDIIFLGGETLILSREDVDAQGIGIGNFTYTVGLFRLMSGEKRNLPIVHFGTIALVPDDEKIPVWDWRDRKRKNKLQLEGYLVESQSLAGLSGSPVFVRPEVAFDPAPLGIGPINAGRPKGSKLVRGGAAKLFLLGLWQGAWEAPPDEVKAAQSGAAPGAKVPVGMGVVVPCYKILELLEMPQVKADRDELVALFAEHGAGEFIEAEGDQSHKR